MNNAASALQRAKRQGRGSLQFYTFELTRTAVAHFHLESDLRQALRGDELVLHFQPQVSVRSGAIVGGEALLRWRHPEQGLLLPGRFIPLAEDTGLVEGVGAWVLREACRQVRRWMAEGLPSLRVAVNLSAREISSSTLKERIAATLAETGLDPGQLELEITESSVMAHLEAAVGTLRAVKTLGVTIALDDFGTGYSSLNHLRRFPLDRLKLDGSFIRQIGHDETAQAIAHAVIELGHGLRLGVVAEGVETSAQLEFLRAHGCDAYQGHLFAAALPPEEFAERLRGVSVRAEPGAT
jgi:EAL domain-containing protein (putative c-di-GMP-specific phosphodiesterase class I)